MLAQLFKHHHSLPSIEKWLLFFSLVLGLLMVFIVPPFQKPDEQTHFYKAMSIASGTMICHKDATGVFQNAIPRYLLEFPEQMFAKHIASSLSTVFPKHLYLEYATKHTFDRTLVNEPSSCSLPFLLYLPVGLLLLVPVQLGFNPLLIFYAGRLINFGLAFGIFYWAYKKASPGTKLIPLFVLSLPMVLYQLSSFSKDALHLSFGMLAFSYLLAFFEKKHITRREIVIFFISLAVAILARPQYILLAVLVLLVPYHKIQHRRFLSKIAATVFVWSMIGIIALSISVEMYSAKAVSLGNARPNEFVYPNAQWHYLLEHPIHLLGIASQTFEQNNIFYWQSGIGLLGSFEFGVPWYVYFFYLILVLSIFSMTEMHLPQLTKTQLAVMTGVVFGTVGSILLSFYIYASPVGASTVYAVQGRYFLLLVPYFAWIVAATRKQWRGKILPICLGIVVVTTVLAITHRYYDDSHHYYRTPVDLKSVDVKKSSPIIGEVYQQVQVDKAKKLRGVSMLVARTDGTVSIPYLLEIRDSHCSGVLGSEVIDAHQLSYGEWNDALTEVVTGYDNVCVRIAPYYVAVGPAEALQIVEDHDQLLLAPIYLN